MKIDKLILILLLITSTLITGCKSQEKNKESNEYLTCHGKSGDFCVQVYEPVCGEDGKTYSNSCEACKVVNKYKKGEC